MAMHITRPTQAITMTEQCIRCRKEDSVLVSRKEPFCSACFVRFIRGKQRKYMSSDEYKVKYKDKQPQRVLLPVSCGSSSLVLLDAVVSTLREQHTQHRGRQGFELVVCCIDFDSTAHSFLSKFQEKVDTEGLSVSFKVVDVGSLKISRQRLHSLRLDAEFQLKTTAVETEALTVSDLLSQFSDRSTKEDFQSVILKELIYSTARMLGIHTIVFGHSMTRLAVQVLSLTVRGRGSEIAVSIDDGDVSFEDTTFKVIHPLRDVLGSEIVHYVRLRELEDLVPQTKEYPKPLLRNSTIDQMVSNYFGEVGSDYSEVVSNVVKIGSKLQPYEGPQCTVCGACVAGDPSYWLKTITVDDPEPAANTEARRPERLATGETVCYACIVDLASEKTAVKWPRGSFEKEVLDEYIIDE